MQQTVARLKLQDEVIFRLAESPVVTLLGARQVGKTTLARQVQERVGTATVFDLESPTGRAALDRTPELALRDCEGLVVIYQVQRMLSLFEILRPICDDAKRRANFLLLGSASSGARHRNWSAASRSPWPGGPSSSRCRVSALER